MRVILKPKSGKDTFLLMLLLVTLRVNSSLSHMKQLPRVSEVCSAFQDMIFLFACQFVLQRSIKCLIFVTASVFVILPL